MTAGDHANAANAYFKSVKLGNHTDWQALVELAVEYPNIQFA